jgi:hypothetical protein
MTTYFMKNTGLTLHRLKGRAVSSILSQLAVGRLNWTPPFHLNRVASDTEER